MSPLLDSRSRTCDEHEPRASRAVAQNLDGKFFPWIWLIERAWHGASERLPEVASSFYTRGSPSPPYLSTFFLSFSFRLTLCIHKRIATCILLTGPTTFGQAQVGAFFINLLYSYYCRDNGQLLLFIHFFLSGLSLELLCNYFWFEEIYSMYQRESNCKFTVSIYF